MIRTMSISLGMLFGAAWLITGCGGDDSVGAPDGGGDVAVGPEAGLSEAGRDAAPVIPTVSSWVGTNVAGDMTRVDVSHQLAPFDTPSQQKDANGYPVAGASGKSATDVGFLLPSGTYKIAYKGDGKLDVSGIGKLTGGWNTVNGEQQNQVQITGTPGAFGGFLDLTITNSGNQSVHDVRILFPGFDYANAPTFLPQFTDLLKPFRALRFMDWEATNGSTMANWADRPTSTSFGASPFGEPLEHEIDLINETGKDAWLNIPEHATEDFIHRFAQFVRDRLDFARIDAARDKQGFTTPFRLIIEDSNEVWNGGFSANKTYLDAANAQPNKYTGTYGGTYGPSWMGQISDLMKVGKFHGDRIVTIGNIWKQEFGTLGKSSIVAPVLSGWALGAAFSDVSLRFIKDNYGDPKTYVTYVAIAPYFDADPTTTAALGTLFTSLNNDIVSMDAAFQDFKKLDAEYGVQIVAYEGGQSLTGTADQPIKHLAQHDQRMYDTYRAYLDFWKKHFGEALFMHYSLAGTPGIPEFISQYGYWGSIISVLEDPNQCGPNLPTLLGSESVDSVVHHCPKYRALSEYVPQ